MTRISVFAFMLMMVYGGFAYAGIFDDLSVVPGETECGWNESSVARYRVHSDNNEFTLPETVSQKIESRQSDENGTAVVIESGDHMIAPGGDKTDYLRHTQLVNTDNPLIREYASRISRSKDPLREAERIVDDIITDTGQGIPLISSDEILRLKAGDCTEHAVLLCAILRAAKIPCRAVVGIIFVPDYGSRKNVFVFHMWNEAFVDGRWRLADASFSGEKHPSRYVALSYHSLKSVSPLDYLGAVSTVKNIRITRVK
ncbi:MAG TPA: transglutaminase domain-containing protein [Spirochaetota bacterium]